MAATGLLSITIPNSTVSFDNRRISLPWISGSELICRTRSRLPCFRLGKPPARVLACVQNPRVLKTRLYISGLSFRTTEESLRNAFQNFGKLVEVNLVMDKIANRPRGFAFLRYATEEESQKAIEGMHGKFLDGRVIFVEVAKSRNELRQGLQNKKF